MKLNQTLQLTVANQLYRGLVISLGENTMMVATTSEGETEFAPGSAVQGEFFTSDGIVFFRSRLIAVKTVPVLMFVLERPAALRKVQRRRNERHHVALTGTLIFISTQASLHVPVDVVDVSFGGLALMTPEAPPKGYHCVLLLRRDEQEFLAITRVMHVQPVNDRFKVGVAFVEMSQNDIRNYYQFIDGLNTPAMAPNLKGPRLTL